MLVGLVRTQFDGTAKCRSRRDQYLAVIRSNNSAVVLSQSWLTYGELFRVRFVLRARLHRGSTSGAAGSRIRSAILARTATIPDHRAGRRAELPEPDDAFRTRSALARAEPTLSPVPLESVRARNGAFNAMLTDLEQRYPTRFAFFFRSAIFATPTVPRPPKDSGCTGMSIT